MHRTLTGLQAGAIALLVTALLAGCSQGQEDVTVAMPSESFRRGTALEIGERRFGVLYNESCALSAGAHVLTADNGRYHGRCSVVLTYDPSPTSGLVIIRSRTPLVGLVRRLDGSLDMDTGQDLLAIYDPERDTILRPLLPVSPNPGLGGSQLLAWDNAGTVALITGVTHAFQLTGNEITILEELADLNENEAYAYGFVDVPCKLHTQGGRFECADVVLIAQGIWAAVRDRVPQRECWQSQISEGRHDSGRCPTTFYIDGVGVSRSGFVVSYAVSGNQRIEQFEIPAAYRTSF